MNYQKSDPAKMFEITVIGSYPKPSFLKVPNWFDGVATSQSKASEFDVKKFDAYLASTPQEERERKLDEAIKQVLIEQRKLGIDIPTDGELYRENYIYYQCRLMNGFDFDTLQTVSMRNAQYDASVPRIMARVSAQKNDVLLSQWQRAQALMNLIEKGRPCEHGHTPATGGSHHKTPQVQGLAQKRCRCRSTDVKMTLPGPMTILGSAYNAYYESEDELLWDLAGAINTEVLKLVRSGARCVQIDEPLFARQPERARDVGFRCLRRCFAGIDEASPGGEKVTTMVHICCGYSDELNDQVYKKAGNHAYVKLAEYGLDELGGCVDYFSIEDAHTRVPLEFFRLMKKTGIVLGCVKVCRKEVESRKEIVGRVLQILDETGFEPSRLMLAPDCGLGMLPKDILVSKMTALNQARDILRYLYQSPQSQRLDLAKQEPFHLIAKL